MAVILEAGKTVRLRLVGIDRKRIVIASPRMGRVMDAAAERPFAPFVDNVESQRRLRLDLDLDEAGAQFAAWYDSPSRDPADWLVNSF